MSFVETFDNAYPNRDYTIIIECPEFTSMCPKTGHPDFGTIRITYIPDQKCLELKSLKLYIHAFRNEGIFYEMVTNKILDDLVASCQPRWMKIEGGFNVRGGISSIIQVEHRKDT